MDGVCFQNSSLYQSVAIKEKKTHRALTYSIHRKQRFFRLFNQLFTIAFEFEIHKSQARYVSIVHKSNSEKDQLNVCGADKLYQKLLNWNLDLSEIPGQVVMNAEHFLQSAIRQCN